MDGTQTNSDTPVAERETYRGAVMQWEADFFGHMNVRFYVSKFDDANWQYLASLGMDREYFEREHRAFFAVSQQIDYLSELMPGDPVVISTALVGMTEKKLVLRHTMRHAFNGETAAVVHLTAVHIDRDIRKTTAMAGPYLAACREALVEAAA